jgi:hypothetical protein
MSSLKLGIASERSGVQFGGNHVGYPFLALGLRADHVTKPGSPPIEREMSDASAVNITAPVRSANLWHRSERRV